jgi:hypothetical protein
MSMVYLDSSFVSAYVTDRTDAKSIVRRETSREWWGPVLRWAMPSMWQSARSMMLST